MDSGYFENRGNFFNIYNIRGSIIRRWTLRKSNTAFNYFKSEINLTDKFESNLNLVMGPLCSFTVSTFITIPVEGIQPWKP